jgi:glyoxylase I family protein
MVFKRIDHVEIIPSDFEKTLKFYAEVMGFKLKERVKVGMPPMQEIVFMTLNDTMIEILSVKDPPPVASRWKVGYCGIALEVEDMDKAIAYLKTKGVGISQGPVQLGPSKRAEIQDPDGLTIELRQW